MRYTSADRQYETCQYRKEPGMEMSVVRLKLVSRDRFHEKRSVEERMYLIVEGRRRFGSIELYINRKHRFAYIGLFFVRKKFRGHGLGYAAFRLLKKQLRGYVNKLLVDWVRPSSKNWWCNALGFRSSRIRGLLVKHI